MLNKFLPILLIINTSMHAYGYIQNTNNTNALLNNTTNNNMQSITNNNKRSLCIEVHNSEDNIVRNEQLNNNIRDVITNAISSNDTEQLNDIIDIIINAVINTTQQFRRAQDALSINEHNLQKLKKNRMKYKRNKINNKEITVNNTTRSINKISNYYSNLKSLKNMNEENVSGVYITNISNNVNHP